MTSYVDHIDGVTYHGRKGGVENAFSYSVDYLMLDAEAEVRTPWPFRRNRKSPVSLFDADHGGAPGEGRGAKWLREVLADHDIPFQIDRIELIAQPRVLGHVFNPVSFWVVRDPTNAIRVIVPEVTNTYGDRHSYLCHNDDWSEILPSHTLAARKIFYVSPFQPVEGDYAFRFAIDDERIVIRIDYTTGNGGLLATLAGPRRPLTTWALLRAMLRRPFGSRRVLGLIHWQAFKLWWKGAKFRSRPVPPVEEVSR